MTDGYKASPAAAATAPHPDVKAPVVEHQEHLPPDIALTKDSLENEWFVASIDLGTTSSRVLIFNSKGEPVASHQLKLRNHHPEPGLVLPLLFCFLLPLFPFTSFPL